MNILLQNCAKQLDECAAVGALRGFSWLHFQSMAGARHLQRPVARMPENESRAFWLDARAYSSLAVSGRMTASSAAVRPDRGRLALG